MAEKAAEAILLGGPRDQEQVDTAEPAVLHLEIDDLVHRYIRTHQHRTIEGKQLVVYNYDGEERAGSIR